MNKIKGNKILCYAVAVLIASVLIAIAVCGHVLSRYAGTEEYTYNQITIDDFYFTVDILGDSVDTDTSTKTINIYGGSAEQTIKINVRNYFDSLRVTSSAIDYTIASNSDSIVVKDSNASNTVGGNVTQTFSTGGSQQSTTYSLCISSFSTAETVTVTIKSSSPFTKTLTLVFNLVVASSDVTCSITSGSPYAELIIKTDIALGTGKLKISWTGLTDLQFDNTNSFFALDSGSTTAATSTADIAAEKSVSVKFFTDSTSSSANYTATQAESGGTYTITISTSG